jgi:uncharacterized protein (TIGR02145 family)
MRIQLSKIVRANSIRPLLAAALGLALTFTLSCSGGDPDDNGGGGSSSSAGGGHSSGGNPGGISSSGGGGNGSGSCGTGETVVIGSQTWMKRNLNCNVSGSKCYDNDEANCAKYGRLYNWETAKTACPSGWHLPSDAEWTTLTDFVGSGAGTKLKSTSGWNDNGNGTDEFGFSALPGGGSSFGGFSGVGYNGNWWSSTEFIASNAYSRYMGYDGAGVSRSYYDKAYFISVRCVQD